jgi:polyketide synthase PksM
VIGGAGGIGEVWTQWVMQHCNAQVVWIGRRAIDDSIRAKQQKLAQFGQPPLYVQADATDAEALLAAKAQIAQQFPNQQIRGVIHSAIVLADMSLARMDETTFRSSLQAKVAVSVALAKAFADASEDQQALDWVLFFSSLQSFTKEPGQSNYAAGCTFKDSYALQLQQQLMCDVKTINWGYWGSVGIVSSDDYRDVMAAGGIGSIEKEDGMQTLASCLATPFAQMAVLKVTQQAVIDALCPPEKVTVMHKKAQPKISALKARWQRKQQAQQSIQTSSANTTDDMA